MNFLYILLALVVLMVLITVHEFGHFIAGKILGFKINEFAIGFGPAIFKRKNKTTGEIFSIRMLPLGGFCAFEGEDEENPHPDAFNNKPAWRRLIVLVSGVLFNFLFGIVTAAIFLMVNGYGLPVISDFAPNNPNEGLLQKGDIVTKINGQSIEIYRSMSDLTSKIKAGEDITITVIRDGKTVDVKGVKKYRTQAFYFVADSSNLKDAIYDKNGLNAWDIEAFKEEIKKIQPEFNTETGKYEDFTHYGLFYNNKPCYSISYLSRVEGKVFNKLGNEYSLADFVEIINKTDPVYDEELKEYKEFSHKETFYKEDGSLYTDDEIIELAGIEVVFGSVYSDQELKQLAGITLSKPTDSIGFIYYNTQVKYGFFECLLKAWPFCIYMCGLILSSLAGIFTGSTALAELGGTVTAVSQIAEISKIGLTSFLLLLPMLSMNLAVFNILPIPALDGARCVFVIIEMIFRKPVPRKIENLIHSVGLFVLLGLVVFLDVYHFFIA